MKNFLSINTILLVVTLNAQIPAYYNSINLDLTEMSLESELTSKMPATHTNQLSYAPEVWNTLKVSDLDSTNSDNVILVYDRDDTDSDETIDRTRDKDFSGGSNSNEWKRKHVFSKSKSTPDLGISVPGLDANNLRPSNVDFNGARSNREFATGSLTTGNIGSYWYPGDERKGDIDRIYMYVKYTLRCTPK